MASTPLKTVMRFAYAVSEDTSDISIIVQFHYTGTLESRGMIIQRDTTISADNTDPYAIPYTEKLHAFPLFRFVPCLPCFDEKYCRCHESHCRKSSGSKKKGIKRDHPGEIGEYTCWSYIQCVLYWFYIIRFSLVVSIAGELGQYKYRHWWRREIKSRGSFCGIKSCFWLVA